MVTFVIAAGLLVPFGSLAGDMPVVLALVGGAVLLLYWVYDRMVGIDNLKLG